MLKPVAGYYNGSVTTDEVQSEIAGYQFVIFAFWVSPSQGVSGAADSIVSNPTLIATIKSEGKQCILAAGGDSYIPFTGNNGDIASDSLTGTEYGTALAQYAQENNFDGVNLDIENINAGDLDAINWLIDATNAVKATDASLSISHAPQAPYFLASGGYVDVESGTNNAVDFYYIQYYNQNTYAYQAYDTYDKIFPTTYNNQPNATSIESITASGISANKLVVGKPIISADATNTGYIALNDFLTILQTAETNGVPFGGVMGWKIDSDDNGAWGDAVNTALNG